ncbi:unnamed protein product [Chrysoparadoxa australica]
MLLLYLYFLLACPLFCTGFPSRMLPLAGKPSASVLRMSTTRGPSLSLNDLLTDRAVATVRAIWGDLQGDVKAEWLDKFEEEQARKQQQNWGTYLWNLLNAEAEESIVRVTVKEDSAEVQRSREERDARPTTQAEWRHTLNMLSADWDAEAEAESALQLEYPPSLVSKELKDVVVPSDIAKNIMTMREAIAEEWREDLKRVDAENAALLQWQVALVSGEEAKFRPLVWEEPAASTPLRAESYDKLLALVTASAMETLMKDRVKLGDKRTLQWLERFAEEQTLKLKEREPEKEVDDRAGREGNAVLEAMFTSGGTAGAKVGRALMDVRSAAAQAFQLELEGAPADHSVMLRTYLEQKWNSPT